MKRWRLLFEFYQKNGIAVLFLLLLMTVSLFFFVQFLGYLGYQTYSLRIMDQLGFQDGAYFMAAEGYDEWQRNENIAYQALRKQEFPAVKSVTNPAYTQGELQGYGTVNILLCDQAFREQFDFADKGSWFSEDMISADAPKVVTGGLALSAIAPGDVLNLTLWDRTGQPIGETPVQVIGTDKTPTLGFSLGFKGAEVAAYRVFENVHKILYLPKEDYVNLLGEGAINYHSNFLLTFQDDATTEEKQEVYAFLTQYGSYVTYDDIRQTSYRDIKRQVRAELPKPLFLLGVSMFSMISLSALLTSKQMKDYRIYYLVGYSKRRSFFDTFLAIAGIGVVAGGLNLCYLAYLNHAFPALASDPDKALDYAGYLVMNQSAWYVLLFVALTAVVSVILPFSMLRKQSVMERYRRSL